MLRGEVAAKQLLKLSQPLGEHTKVTPTYYEGLLKSIIHDTSSYDPNQLVSISGILLKMHYQRLSYFSAFRTKVTTSLDNINPSHYPMLLDLYYQKPHNPILTHPKFPFSTSSPSSLKDFPLSPSNDMTILKTIRYFSSIGDLSSISSLISVLHSRNSLSLSHNPSNIFNNLYLWDQLLQITTTTRNDKKKTLLSNISILQNLLDYFSSPITDSNIPEKVYCYLLLHESRSQYKLPPTKVRDPPVKISKGAKKRIAEQYEVHKKKIIDWIYDSNSNDALNRASTVINMCLRTSKIHLDSSALLIAIQGSLVAKMDPKHQYLLYQRLDILVEKTLALQHPFAIDYKKLDKQQRRNMSVINRYGRHVIQYYDQLRGLLNDMETLRVIRKPMTMQEVQERLVITRESHERIMAAYRVLENSHPDLPYPEYSTVFSKGKEKKKRAGDGEGREGNKGVIGEGREGENGVTEEEKKRKKSVEGEEEKEKEKCLVMEEGQESNVISVSEDEREKIKEGEGKKKGKEIHKGGLVSGLKGEDWIILRDLTNEIKKSVKELQGKRDQMKYQSAKDKNNAMKITIGKQMTDTINLVAAIKATIKNTLHLPVVGQERMCVFLKEDAKNLHVALPYVVRKSKKMNLRDYDSRKLASVTVDNVEKLLIRGVIPKESLVIAQGKKYNERHGNKDADSKGKAITLSLQRFETIPVKVKVANRDFFVAYPMQKMNYEKK